MHSILLLSALTLAQAPSDNTPVQAGNPNEILAAQHAAYDAIANVPRETPTTRVARAVRPSVVFIETEGSRMIRRGPFGSTTIPVQGAGTGVVVHEDGYVITNYHVVRGARRIQVSFAGEPVRHLAELLSYREAEDLALLRITNRGSLNPDHPANAAGDQPLGLTAAGRVRRAPKVINIPARPYPAVRMGTSSDLMVGEIVVAVGNPHGQQHTVSNGIVSGLHRDIQAQNLLFRDLIQTDASINLGNSGGPLLNIRGELIGINTVMNVSAENIGFAIPVDRVREVLEDELFPSAHRAWIGIDLGEDQSVTSVITGSPAAQAGLCTGDRILSIAGRPAATPADWTHASLQLTPGAASILMVQRGSQEVRMTLIPWNKSSGILWKHLGLRVREVASGRTPYIVVTAVRQGGPAADIGTQIGDLIPAVHPVEAGNRPASLVRNRRDLAAIVEAMTTGTMLEIDIYRDDDRNQEYDYGELYKGALLKR
jgi:serine protease Do